MHFVSTGGNVSRPIDQLHISISPGSTLRLGCHDARFSSSNHLGTLRLGTRRGLITNGHK